MNLKNEIKENANFILKKQNKYYYFYVAGSNSELLGTSNSNSEAKEVAINKLKGKKDKSKLYKLTLRKANKMEKKEF